MSVSRVINHHPIVKASTSAKVMKAIAGTGYSPNDAARMLKGRAVRTIGLDVPDLSDLFSGRCTICAQRASPKSVMDKGGSSYVVEQSQRLGLFSRFFGGWPGPSFILCASTLSIVFAALQPGAWAQQLRLTNPLNIERAEEVIEIPLGQVAERLHFSAAQLESLVATDAATKQRIPSQLFSDRPGADPDTLLLLVKLPAKGMVNVAFSSNPAAPPQEPLVFGRTVPKRKDDFAWENRVVAYRIYGPALEATGEISSGIDVWSKRIPNFVVDSFYKQDHQAALTHNSALSYHKDNGIGLDSYDVGKTRGCGGTAVWADGKLDVSKNYSTVRIIATGPVRFEFEVTYAPWLAGGRMVTETKRITLDAGSHLNKIVSTFTFDGNLPVDLAAGIAIHKGADAALPAGRSIASVWDTPQDASAGRIATGLVSLPAEHAKTLTAADHALMLFARRSGEPFTYFAGSGWSKADMPTQADWNAYLDKFLEFHQHPITTAWTK
jgi:hypothetical protein